MNKSQKILIILIVFIIMLIIMILSTISVLNKGNEDVKNTLNMGTNNGDEYNKTNNYVNSEGFYEEHNDYVTEQDITEKTYEYNKLKYVTDRNKYFTIDALFNNYINLMGYKNKMIKNILSPNYISKYNINDDNMFNILSIPEPQNVKQYYKIDIKEMLETQIDDDIYIYIAKGNVSIVGEKRIFSVQVMFEVDMNNNLYNTYPYQYIEDNNLNNLKHGDLLKNYKKEEINDRENNKFNYVTKTDAEMATEYFENYKQLLNDYQDEAYDKLNLEYSQKRFGNKENFKSYLKEKDEDIFLMQIDKYKVFSTDNYIDYICSDQYENLYIFRQEEGVMRYSAFLDNYTVMLDEYANEYNEMNKFEKSKYNLTKVINMVNTKDYKAIYNVLNQTFKNNNFESLESLKLYIKDNFFNINLIEIEDITYTNEEYDAFKLKLINAKNRSENKNMTIVINQSEGLEFTMSFSFE